jgi:NDP-mannose synthase
MQAIILAGGKGTRLKPYTNILPKPLMPIGDMPILEIVINQLRKSGFNKITLAVGHLHHLLQSFFGSGSRFQINIEYSLENKSLGTAGPISLIDKLEENFLVMNGDILTDLNFASFMEYHILKKGIATLAYCKKDVPITLGVVDIDESNRLINYREKPILSYYASMGIYCMNKKILDFIPKGEYKDLPELMLNLIKEAIPVYSYYFDGIWLDIGRVEDYEQAIEIYDRNQKKF